LGEKGKFARVRKLGAQVLEKGDGGKKKEVSRKKDHIEEG